MADNLTPTPKVTAAVLAGSLSAIAVWCVGQFTGVEVPAAVASALTTVLAFAAGWITSEDEPADAGAVNLTTVAVVLVIVCALIFIVANVDVSVTGP